MDFSGITTTGAGLTLSAVAGTYNVKNLSFGTTASTITTAEILNFNGDGTAGQTTLNLAGSITLPSPSGSIVTMGSDLTLNLSNAVHVLNFEKNSNVIGTAAAVPVLVVNSKVTGGGAASTLTWGALKTAYGATGSAAQNMVLTNNTSNFDAQISGIRGQLSYTSIANSGVASSLGAGTTGANGTISISNSGMFNYVGSGDQASNRTITFNGTSNINNYATTASVLTLNGTFTGAATASNGNATVGVGVSTGNTVVLSSVISDTAGGIQTAVTKKGVASYYTATGVYDTTNGNGNGTLELNGANTYTGVTTVTAGTVKLGNAAGLGNGGASIGPKLNGSIVNSSGNGGTTVASGATLDINGKTGVSEVISIAGSGVNGAGALVNNSATPASIAGGTVSSLTGGTLTGLSAVPTVIVSAPVSGTTATATASLGLSAQSFTIGGTNTGYVTAPTVTISGGGGTGAVATATISGGAVTAITITNPGVGYTSAPTLTFSAGNATATGNATSFILQALQVTNAGSGYTTAPTITFSSGTVVSATTANLSSVAMTASSSVGGSGDLAIGAVVSGASTATLTKIGAGTLTLSGANTYAGATAISAGTLSVNSIGTVAAPAASALGAPATSALGTISIGSGATSAKLVYTGSAQTTERIISLAVGTGGATIDQSGTGLLKFTSNLASTGAAATDQRKTLTLQGSTSGTGEFSGNIGDSVAGTVGQKATSVVKSGTGTWTLSGLNTYTGGTTVNAGTLNIANNFTMSGANQIAIAATGVAGTNYATVSSTGGTLTFGGTLGINVTASLAGGESFNLFTASGGVLAGNFGITAGNVSLTGTYIASLTNNGSGIWTGTTGGLDFTFATSGVNAGILSVSAIPEPSTYATIFGALALAGTAIHRRRAKRV